MNNVPPLATRHMQHAHASLDEARYRLSCAVVACGTNRALADRLTTMRLILEHELRELETITPAQPESTQLF